MKLLLLMPFLLFGRDNAAYKLQLQHADRGYPLKGDHFLFAGNVDFTIKGYEIKCSSAELNSDGVTNLYDVKISNADRIIFTAYQMEYNEDNGYAILKEQNSLKETLFSFVDGAMK